MSTGDLKQIGPYTIRGVLGKGGMATVYRAFQPNLNREVAIKVMSNRFIDDEASVERFRREALAVASLHHPNILTVYDTGEFNGTPFIVSELLSGKTLRERMGQPLELTYCARIISQLAGALDYAHENGIIHRDVKPSNVLLDARDRAVLSDFGIVKLLNDSANMRLTATNMGVGTPEYMSPEQGTGEPLDGRSDQYSLGVMLYEMLTGKTPYRADTPLAILMAHVSRPLPDPRQYNVRISPQVADVLNKVLAKKQAERYPSCTAFAEAFYQAIQTPTMNMPFLAETTTNPATVSDAPLAALDPTTPVEVLRARQAGLPPNYANPAVPPAEPPSTPTMYVRPGDSSTPPPNDPPSTPTVYVSGGESKPVAKSEPLEHSTVIGMQPPVNQPPVYNQAYGQPPQQPNPPLNNQAYGQQPLQVQRAEPLPPVEAGKSNKGLIIGIIAFLVIAAAAVVGIVIVLGGSKTDATPTAVANTTTTGSTTAAGNTTPTVTTTGTEVSTTTTYATTTPPATTTLAPTSKGVLTSIAATQLATLNEHTASVPIAAWAPDGKTLATGSWDTTAKIWNAQGKSIATLTGHTGWVIIVAWSPDGKTLATGSLDSTIRLWKADGSFIATLQGHTGEITNIAWSPDGKYLASSAKDKTVRLWTADGKPAATLNGHTDIVVIVSWSPDSKTIASGSWDKTVRVWDTEGKTIYTLNGFNDNVNMVAYSPDGKTIAAASKDKTARLWSAEGKPIATLSGHTEEIYTLAWSLDSKILATSSGDKTIRLWSPDGTFIATLSDHTGPVYTLAWSPDKILASGSGDKTARLWNADGKLLATLSGHTDLISTVAWSPDGKIVTTCSWDKTARLWKI